jgi:hypothetical protein
MLGSSPGRAAKILAPTGDLAARTRGAGVAFLDEIKISEKMLTAKATGVTKTNTIKRERLLVNEYLKSSMAKDAIV